MPFNMSAFIYKHTGRENIPPLNINVSFESAKGHTLANNKL